MIGLVHRRRVAVTVAAATAAVICLDGISAFVVPAATRRPHASPSASAVRMSSSADDEVAALMAAAAKMREEAKQLSEELGYDPGADASAAEQAVERNALGAAELTSVLAKQTPPERVVPTGVGLDEIAETGALSLWGAAVSRGNSRPTAPISVSEPFSCSLQDLESRSTGKLTADSLGIGGEMDVSLDDFKDATVIVVAVASVLAVAALAFLPENVGATVCYFCALVPIIWIGVGSTAPGALAGLIQASRSGGEGAEERKERVCHHEAGHMLCGYLCGLPVRSYSVDEKTGVPCVEFESARGDLSSNDVNALTVVALSGSVAEALQYGTAKGGDSDLMELQNCFRRSDEFMGDAVQRDRTRWGALAAFMLIKEYRQEYDNLVGAFREGKDVNECIVAMEAKK
mmetsp:Transcript_31163/g.61693  ORF Transcript_31163/g.61693 Transcript_31163/m.61693 type:complete len:403 (-) Transcript_31163:123-1331(-)